MEPRPHSEHPASVWGPAPMVGRARRFESAPVAGDTAPRFFRTARSSAVVSPLFSERRARAVVHVLDEVPELRADLDPAIVEAASARCRAATILLSEAVWRPPSDPGSCRGWLGLLVVDGLLSRTV